MKVRVDKVSLCTKEYVVENEEFTDERPQGVEYDD